MARSTTHELPEVQKVDGDETIATAYFENGAKLRYKRTTSGWVEQIFAPSDADSVMEESAIGHIDSAINALSLALDEYEYYDTVDELRRDWSTLAEWITHD